MYAPETGETIEMVGAVVSLSIFRMVVSTLHAVKYKKKIEVMKMIFGIL